MVSVNPETRMKTLSLALAMVVLAGCAAYDGRNLKVGASTPADVEAAMGRPAEKLKAADGDTIYFYPHQPFGRTMVAVRIAPQGVVRSVEQVLTEANLRKMVPGVTTREQAREVFGPPYHVADNRRMEREIWEYTMWSQTQWEHYLYLQFSPDGILREAFMLKDYRKEMGDSFSK
jgi:hypothetical protein